MFSLALPFLPFAVIVAGICGRSRARGGSGSDDGAIGKFLSQARKLILVAQSDGLVRCLELIERLADEVQFVDLGIDCKQSAQEKQQL